MDETPNHDESSRRRSSFPKSFYYAGLDDNGDPKWVDDGGEDDLDLLYPGTPSLSGGEDDHHVENKEPKSLLRTDGMCAFCQTIPFAQIGFSRGGDYLLKPFQHPPRSLLDVQKAAANGCILCLEVRDTIRQFYREHSDYEQECATSECDVTYMILKVGEWPATAADNRYDLYHDPHLFRLGISFSLSAFPQHQRLWLSFQRCTIPPVTVEQFVHNSPENTLALASVQPCDGRIRPQQLDFRLLRRWISECSEQHGLQCTGLFTGPSPTALRFLDVELCCIVDDPGNANYVALSYTWGAVSIPTLTTQNEAKYRQTGHLSSRILPATFIDTLAVAKGLRFRYLWIDCFCILQDSETDKAKYIPQMDSIYGHASVTLVAASGNINFGLSGVRTGTRKANPQLLSLDKIGLIRAQDSLLARPEGGYASLAQWATRAWTFQEKVFGSRCLFFTEDQVYWGCQKASWCEDGAWELADGATAFRTALAIDRQPLPWSDNPEQVARVYADFLVEFTYRNLSFETDVANACAGILNGLQRSCGWEFYWGLPSQSLERGLDWTAYRLRGRPLRIRRRFDAQRNELAKFPSWSWQGWTGRVEAQGFTFLEEGSFPVEKYLIIGLKFYRLDPEGTLIHLPQAREFDPAIMADFFGKDVSDLTGASDFSPGDVPSFPDNMSKSMLLCFWTDTIPTNILDGQDTSTFDCELEIEEDRTLSRGGLTLTGRGILASGGDEGDLIVVGRRLRLPEELAVLLVSWKDGIAYRRGSLTVHKTTWLALENRVWKPIYLA